MVGGEGASERGNEGTYDDVVGLELVRFGLEALWAEPVAVNESSV